MDSDASPADVFRQPAGRAADDRKSRAANHQLAIESVSGADVNQRLTICAVSGGRADYGLLVPVLRLLRDDSRFHLELVLTGQHLSGRASGTAARVRADGFEVSAEIDIELGADDAVAITKSAARGLDGMADVLARLKPDLVLLLGDRYEIAVTAIAATIARLPIAHIA